MALFLKSANVGERLREGLIELAESGLLERHNLYPVIDHSDYFAVVVLEDEGKKMRAEVRFKNKYSVGRGADHAWKGEEKVKTDEDGWKKGITALVSAGYVEKERDKTYVIEGRNYCVELDRENGRVTFSRILDEPFDSSRTVAFAKNMHSVFDVLLKRNEEIEEYGFAD